MSDFFEPKGSLAQRQYKLRQLAELCPQSTRGISLEKLPGDVFATIERNALAEARVNAATSGRLFPTRERDDAGRVITTYAGDPMAWMKHFMAPSAISRLNMQVDTHEETFRIKNGQRIVIV